MRGGTHLDAVTSTTSGYTAAYDAAGDMLCRAPTSSTTCSGTQTGQQMSYDAMRRLATWQNVPGTSPSQKDTSVYDGEGEGQRIQQIVTNSGTTTTTNYIQGIEEIATTGSTTTTTKYYTAGLVQAIVGEWQRDVPGARRAGQHQRRSRRQRERAGRATVRPVWQRALFRWQHAR